MLFQIHQCSDELEGLERPLTGKLVARDKQKPGSNSWKRNVKTSTSRV